MRSIFLTFIYIALTGVAAAETRKAFIYDIGKTAGEPKYTQTTEIIGQLTGEASWSSKIEDGQGKLMMTEVAEINNGDLVRQYVEQLQTNEAYEIKVTGKDVTFTSYKIKNGKKAEQISAKTVNVGDNFITGPLTETYLGKRWPDLSKGKTVKVEFGVFEISKAVGFQFKKIATTGSTMELQMKPSNLLISMLVDNIRIDFDKEQRRMVRFIGRTPLQNFVEGKWRPMDAEILYPKVEAKP